MPDEAVGRKVLGGLRTTGAIILSIAVLIFGVFALVNFFGGVAAQLLQIGVWVLLLVPSIPVLYAIEATEKSKTFRTLVGLTSLVLWALVFLAIRVYG